MLYCTVPSTAKKLLTVTPSDANVGKSFNAFWTVIASAP